MTTLVQTPPAIQPSPAVERPRRKRFTLSEYQRAIESGVFGPEERLELIRGEIIEKMPQNEPHAYVIRLAGVALRRAFETEDRYFVQSQLPVVLPRDSQPEPDFAVLRGSVRDIVHHPTPDQIVLILEIADTSVFFDLEEKAALYAEDGIQDYWVMILPTRELRVHREPQPAVENAPARYRSIQTYTEEQEVVPLVEPGIRLRVADLLPPVVPPVEEAG